MGSLWPKGRAQAAVAHSVVNGVAVLSLASLHLWGSLPSEWAAGAILGVCGFWVSATRNGPPSGPPGISGALLLAVEAAMRKFGG